MSIKRKIALTVIILAAVVIIAQGIPFFRTMFGKSERLVFYLNADSLSELHYKYELSGDDILREADHYSARHFLNCGSGYAEVWEFEIVGDGEVTVNWTGYEGGVINDDMSFYETYLVKDGEHTKIFDSRNAA